MGSLPPADAKDRPRVGVILVAGVGDDGPGDTSDAVTRRLLETTNDWETADEHQIVVRDAGRTTHTAHWARLNPSDDSPATPIVDLYEMHWADLSRFPSGLVRFVSTLYALTIQIANLGQQALRPFVAGRRKPDRWAEIGERLLTLSAYALAFPVLMVTAATAVMTAGLTLAVTTGGGRGSGTVPTILVLIGLLGAAGIGASRLTRGGWHPAVRYVAFAVAGLGCALVLTCALVWRDGRVALANALTYTVAYAFRPVWLILLVLATAATVALLGFGLRHGRGPEQRAAHTALATLIVGPLIFAIASAVIVASFGVLAQRTASDRTWGAHAADVRCLRTADDWRVPERCALVVETGANTPAKQLIAELVDRIDKTEGDRRTLARAARDVPTVENLAQREALRRSIDEDRAALRRVRDDAHLDNGAYAQFPVDWALRLFGFALLPLVWAIAALGVLTFLLLIIASGYLANLIGPLRRILADRSRLVRDYLARNPRTDEQREHTGQTIIGGSLFNWIPKGFGSPIASVLAALSIGVTLLAGIVSWVIDPAWIGGLGIGVPAIGRIAALLVTGLLVVVRVLGVNPFANPGGTVRGGLERLRTVLDVAYDITNYLRPSRGGGHKPREEMVNRYRAVLHHVLEQKMDGLVILCHSQGTVLSAACLFGDAAREPAVEPLVGQGIGTFPSRVSLMTFGSPLRQIYDERFPHQFDWISGPELDPARLAPLTRHWWNIYRSGDYIGRALWASVDDASTFDPDLVAAKRVASGVDLADVCLGPGGHGGYWSDRAWSEFVIALIRDAAGDDQTIEALRPTPATWPVTGAV